MSEKQYWIGFSVFPGIGPKKFSSLLDHFSSAENAWNADESELEKVLGQNLSAKFISYRKKFSFDGYLKKLDQKEVWITTLEDEEYPTLLRSIENPPFLLFGRGRKETLSKKNIVGIVGTRKITQYGREVTEMITKDLVDASCCIISGLALGVDAVAHTTTLVSGGVTIAVLGCGVDCCTPRENQAVYDQIVSSGGAVISEFPLSMLPTKGSFPSRNRIIAGMSTAVIVTEGAENSGSLITAHDALVFGRKVFAIPGPITSSLSNGPMRLIKNGAILVTSGKEIVTQLGYGSGLEMKKKQISGETKDENIIIAMLENESVHFDVLVKRLGIDTSYLGSLLSLMELKGLVIVGPGGIISLNR